MKLFRRHKKTRKVSKGIRNMGKTVGWSETVRCNKCNQVFNPNNTAAAKEHEHK